jgi:hypothetical protein
MKININFKLFLETIDHFNENKNINIKTIVIFY